MSLALMPRTAEGEALVAAIDSLAPSLRAWAADADRENTLSADTFTAVQEAGIAAAFVPKALGGFGLTSMHDWIVAICRLAHGDGAVAIALSMHYSATRGMADRYGSTEPGSDEHGRLEEMLAAVGRREMLICSTTTESGTDNLHPLTEAVRTDAGWVVNGRKYFVTMSPVATHVALNVRARGDLGQDHIANVVVPMSNPGIHPNDDWDALGMRGSGSQSVSFIDCVVPADAVRLVGPWGQWSKPVLLHRTLANVPLVGAFLGIAESAYEIGLAGLRSRTQRSADAGVQHMVAEMQIALATCQSLMSRIGLQLDEVVRSPGSLTWEAGHELMKDYQSVKWVVNRQAIDVVHQAMDLAGGGGFLSVNPLTRLYRDVRAGPFMQPHSPVDAREYIGRVELGRYPEE